MWLSRKGKIKRIENRCHSQRLAKGEGGQQQLVCQRGMNVRAMTLFCMSLSGGYMTICTEKCIIKECTSMYAK